MACHGQEHVSLTAIKDILERHRAEFISQLQAWQEKQVQLPFFPLEIIPKSLDEDIAVASERAQVERPDDKKWSKTKMDVPLYVRQSSYEVAQATSEKKRRRSELDGYNSEQDKLSMPWWRMLRCDRISISWQFEAIFAGLIFSNAIYIGVQVEFEASADPDGATFFWISLVYSLLFLIELGIRIFAQGKQFFSVDMGWKILDVVIVLMSILEVIVEVLAATGDGESAGSTGPTSSLRILRMVRITRLIRVLRIVRIVKFIRALRTLVYSIMCTLKSLMWSVLLLIMIMYCFGIILTDAVVGHLQALPPQFADESRIGIILQLRFGSLHRSMITLFQCISGGLNWNEEVYALAEVSWAYSYLFLSYVTFCCFAVLNVMTGVFCNSAIQSAAKDQELAVQAIWQDRERYNSILMEIFGQIDCDQSGSITISEFEKHFNDKEVRALFASLELDASDAWTLFRALDTDGDNEVVAEEFLEGCMCMRGAAKSIDLASFRRDVKKRQHDIMQEVREIKMKTEQLTVKSQNSTGKVFQAVNALGIGLKQSYGDGLAHGRTSGADSEDVTAGKSANGLVCGMQSADFLLSSKGSLHDSSAPEQEKDEFSSEECKVVV
eukprot:TRINITY_DN13246_c0_g3_i1.p1 TRINITY_DN13246_c0_g3~~TRINITY_DN13246_c0_g3_i1.p1  ORF type:complete len:620 (+),score=118.22 TRINITY_DN13246_c0_g3_i1:33-1862(+)